MNLISSGEKSLILGYLHSALSYQYRILRELTDVNSGKGPYRTQFSVDEATRRVVEIEATIRTVNGWVADEP